MTEGRSVIRMGSEQSLFLLSSSSSSLLSLLLSLFLLHQLFSELIFRCRYKNLQFSPSP